MTTTERKPPKHMSNAECVRMIREMRVELTGNRFIVTVPRNINRRISAPFTPGLPSVREQIMGLGYVSKVVGGDIKVIRMEVANGKL